MRPVRLLDPGDDFSYDIFAQAAQAIRRPGRGSADPLGGLRPQRVIGTGASQSCFRLINYVNLFAAGDHVYDGFNPTVCMTTNYPIRTDLVPIMWVNSEVELATQGDGGLLRLWEVAGASHLGWYAYRFGASAVVRDLTAGPGSLSTSAAVRALDTALPPQAAAAPAALGPWDEASAGAYGEHGEGGACPANFFPVRFAYDAALDSLNRWIIDRSHAPSRAARLPRTEVPTRADRGADLNASGGLRLPAIDVPVATYVSAESPCILLGSTVPFDTVSLHARYPTHQAYLCAIDRATTSAVAARHMLAEDGDEMRARAIASTLWGTEPAKLAACRTRAGSTPRT